MSNDPGPSLATDGSPAAAEGTSGRGGGARGILAPALVLVLVGALSFAAMAGGSEGDDAEVPAADGGAVATGSPDDIADDLAPDPDLDLEGSAAEQQAAQEEARAQLDAIATRQPDDPRALGDVDAPVVMVEWADFLCPFCGVFSRDTEPQLIDRYVETGLLRIEWRDLPFQGDQALLAAIGGQAAAAQDAFWEYHEAMFAADLRRDQERVDHGFLLTVATELDLDVAAFRADLDDPELAERVQGEAVLAQSIGITGTPAFIIGGYPLVGAQPLDAFVNVIEAAAQDAGAELP